MAQYEVLEIANDSFYIKKDLDSQECQFAYLHLSENAHDIYVAYFENREVKKPIVYWWEEGDFTQDQDMRRFINEFIGEAYLSLFIKEGIEKPSDKPLWSHPQAINSGIPSIWWNVVNNIKR